VAPAKSKTRYNKSCFIAGKKSAYKKAFVTIAAGETIDLYSNI
jgi:large subunit ribosomal protein L23